MTCPSCKEIVFAATIDRPGSSLVWPTGADILPWRQSIDSKTSGDGLVPYVVSRFLVRQRESRRNESHRNGTTKELCSSLPPFLRRYPSRWFPHSQSRRSYLEHQRFRCTKSVISALAKDITSEVRTCAKIHSRKQSGKEILGPQQHGTKRTRPFKNINISDESLAQRTRSQGSLRWYNDGHSRQAGRIH